MPRLTIRMKFNPYNKWCCQHLYHCNNTYLTSLLGNNLAGFSRDSCCVRKCGVTSLSGDSLLLAHIMGAPRLFTVDFKPRQMNMIRITHYLTTWSIFIVFTVHRRAVAGVCGAPVQVVVGPVWKCLICMFVLFICFWYLHIKFADVQVQTPNN